MRLRRKLRTFLAMSAVDRGLVCEAIVMLGMAAKAMLAWRALPTAGA